MSKKIIYLFFSIISTICLLACNSISNDSNKKDYTLCKEKDNYFIIVNDSYYEKKY